MSIEKFGVLNMLKNDLNINLNDKQICLNPLSNLHEEINFKEKLHKNGLEK